MEKIFGEKTGYAAGAAGVLFMVLAVYVAILAVNAVKENKYIGRDAAGMSSITVSGKGEVYASPDLATMDFSVLSESKTVAEAMEDNTRKMNAIIDAVKSLGVADDDLRTSGFNINPHYDYIETNPETTEMRVYYPSGKRQLSGYDITQTLTVKVRQDNMSKVGQIIQEAAASGANQVGDLQFTIDKPEVLQEQARKQAIEEAKAKAAVLAQQLEVKLGDITGYSEGGYYPTYTTNYAKGMEMDAVQESATPAIQTGQNKIESSVNITYEIR